MSSAHGDFDLSAIASEAEVEILTVETIVATGTSRDSGGAFNATELGYYEAELKSLRDAAVTLNEDEQTLD